MLLLAGVAAVLGSASAWADGCDSKRRGGGSPSSIRDCELQVQAPVSYDGLDSEGWAHHYGGDQPYFRGLYDSYSLSYTSNKHCFSVSKNAVNEADDNCKFDATFTNFCFKKENITSNRPAPASAPSGSDCPLKSRRATTCAWISVALLKMARVQASHSTRLN